MSTRFMKDMRPPNPWNLLKGAGVTALLGTLFATYFLVFTESLDFGGAYLSMLPLIGLVFERISPDANVSSLICLLLASASTLIPLMIANHVDENNVIRDFRRYIAEPANRLTAGVLVTLLVMIVSIECFSLYSLIQKANAPQVAFVATHQPSGFMGWLSDNSGFGIAVSIGLAVLNLAMAFLAKSVFKNMSK